MYDITQAIYFTFVSVMGPEQFPPTFLFCLLHLGYIFRGKLIFVVYAIRVAGATRHTLSVYKKIYHPGIGRSGH